MSDMRIPLEIKNRPILEPGFVPFGPWLKAYEKEACRPVDIAVEREKGRVSVFHLKMRDAQWKEANFRWLERTVKFLLYSVGGYRIYLCGCDELGEEIQKHFSRNGERAFDADFMETVYEKPFEILLCDREHFPAASEEAISLGGHLGGCRIGFDAGGSDRKVSAVIDGETVYSEEVVWFPKLSEDPNYQYQGIVEAFKTAASKMPRVDAIGVSSAGVIVDNRPMVCSLFIKVPKERFEEVKSVYLRAAKEIGDVPLAVANDGDVTALAGAMSLDAGAVLGIAMGTSEAAGYVDREKRILGWINELAFAPVDLQEGAPQDEWSGDYGVGCKYFSQDAVILLAPKAGIELAEELSPAEKLKAVQKLAEEGHEGARNVFRSIGCYLAHTLSLYAEVYDISTVLVLGRVSAGIGGDLLIAECQRVLEDEYPELAGRIRVMLPDEKARRVGQSIAAASLP